MCKCDFDGRADFVRHDVRTARKPHRCYECSSIIRPGERYHAWGSKWEGTVDSWSECDTCRTWALGLTDAQQRECGCSGYELGSLWPAIAEFAEEHLGPNAPPPWNRRPPSGTVTMLESA